MDIFDPIEFENFIIKRDLITYKPNLESYGYNDRIKITVNSDSFTELYNSHIYLRIKTKTILASALQKKIAFVRNGVMQLFSEVMLEQNGVTIKHVKNPGLCHLLISLVQEQDEASSSSEYAYETFTVEEKSTFDVTI